MNLYNRERRLAIKKGNKTFATYGVIEIEIINSFSGREREKHTYIHFICGTISHVLTIKTELNNTNCLGRVLAQFALTLIFI